MTRRYEHSIVVDTSVVQAAGDRKNGPNVSAQSLRTMLEKEIAIAVSDGLREEWYKDRPGESAKRISRYASTWLAKMKGKKLYHKLGKVSPDASLRAACELELTEKEFAAFMKDVFLIEAANEADRRVISHDDNLHRILRSLAPATAKLRGLHWGNPERASCCRWLKNGAVEEPLLQL